jgi:CHAD domain-containing protein
VSAPARKRAPAKAAARTKSAKRAAPASGAPTKSAAHAGPFFARILRGLERDLRPTIPRVIRGGDEEAIHDMRVAIRRLRTLLKIARAVYGRFHADAARAGFTAAHRATGALRDEEVLEETLADVDVTAPAWLAWRERRRARERALRRAVVRRLQSGELTRSSNLLLALVALPVRPSRDKLLAKLARGVIGRATKAVESMRDTPVEDVLGLHDLRIAYKELRYAAELLGAALPADLAAMAEPAARFQKRLGEIHDVDVAILTVRRARLEPATRALVLERLGAMRAKRVGKYVAEMAPAPADANPVIEVVRPQA